MEGGRVAFGLVVVGVMLIASCGQEAAPVDATTTTRPSASPAAPISTTTTSGSPLTISSVAPNASGPVPARTEKVEDVIPLKEPGEPPHIVLGDVVQLGVRCEWPQWTADGEWIICSSGYDPGTSTAVTRDGARRAVLASSTLWTAPTGTALVYRSHPNLLYRATPDGDDVEIGPGEWPAFTPHGDVALAEGESRWLWSPTAGRSPVPAGEPVPVVTVGSGLWQVRGGGPALGIGQWTTIVVGHDDQRPKYRLEVAPEGMNVLGWMVAGDTALVTVGTFACGDCPEPKGTVAVDLATGGMGPVEGIVSQKIDIAADGTLAFVDDGQLSIVSSNLRPSPRRDITRAPLTVIAWHPTYPLCCPGPDGPIEPVALAISPDSSVVVADRTTGLVWRAAPGKGFTILAGNGGWDAPPRSGPETAFGSALDPNGLAVDVDGSIYVSDTRRHRVRRIGADGSVVTVAGTGEAGQSGDGGPATAAQLHSPVGVAIDGDGRLYIADRDNHAIRTVGRDGVISTLPVVSTTLSFPNGIATSADGAVVVADTGHNRVLRLADGVSVELLGPSSSPPIALVHPTGVAAGSDGAIYVADRDAHRVLRRDPAGPSAVVAGAESATCSRFTPWAEQPLTAPSGVAIGIDGRLLIATAGCGQIERLG